MNVMKILSRK